MKIGINKIIPLWGIIWYSIIGIVFYNEFYGNKLDLTFAVLLIIIPIPIIYGIFIWSIGKPNMEFKIPSIRNISEDKS